MPPRHIVTAISPAGGMTVTVTFGDGFTAQVDLSPLLNCGPAFAPLANPSVFRAVVIEGATPVWPGEIDLATDSLRAWCEAGKFMDYEDTENWIDAHASPTQKVA